MDHMVVLFIYLQTISIFPHLSGEGCYILCQLPSSSSSSASSSPFRPQPPALDGSVPRRTSTASSGRQCSPPDLNRELRMAVFPADLNRELRLAVFPMPDLNCDGRAPPDLHCEGRVAAFPRRTSTASQKICQIKRQKECQKICRRYAR